MKLAIKDNTFNFWLLGQKYGNICLKDFKDKCVYSYFDFQYNFFDWDIGGSNSIDYIKNFERLKFNIYRVSRNNQKGYSYFVVKKNKNAFIK